MGIKACVEQLPLLKEVILLGFFDKSLFENFINETQNELNVSIRYIKEESRLGTAGGLYKFREEICDGLDENSSLFVFNCDIIAKFPLQELQIFHKEHGHLCSILTKRVESKSVKNYGCLVSDNETHEVLHYAEKPETFVSDLVNCGVYLFRMEIFERIVSVANTKPTEGQLDIYAEEREEHDQDIKIRLEQDVFRQLAGNQQLYSFEYKGFWCPIKHPADSLSVTRMMLQDNIPIVADEYKKCVRGRVMIHPSASVDTSSVIGDNVTIGQNAKIGKGVRIHDSIILDGVEVRDHSYIVNSIIGWNSVIGQWCRIEGTDGKITIFGDGVKTKPETIVRNSIVLPHKELSRNHNEEILL